MKTEITLKHQDYFTNLDLIKTKILKNSKSGRSKKYLSPADVQTWIKAFRTFDSFSVPKKVSGIAVADWNPVSQRAFVDRKPAVAADLIQNFNDAARLVDNIIVDVHESLHILLLEPFFVGRQKFSSPQQLRECYFSIEAFAFWYCDFILTPLLKIELPDAELLYANSTVSSPRFSPRRAMHAIGVKDNEEILKIYISGFCGRKTKLLNKTDFFAKNLARRVYAFYFDWKKPLHRLYDSLKEMNILNEFQKRFCDVPGIPTVLSDEALKTFGAQDTEEYLIDFWKNEIPRFKFMKENILTAVRYRRKIQTRAYFALVLKGIVEQKLFFCGSGKSINASEQKFVIAALNEYLSRLESALVEDLAKNLPERARQKVELADQFYSNAILIFFKDKNIWVSERRYFNDLMSLGLGTRKFGSHGLTQVLKKDVHFITRLLLEAIRKQPANTEIFLADIHQLGKISTRKSPVQRAQLFRKFLNAENIAPLWSVALSEIDPEQNRFRELINYFP